MSPAEIEAVRERKKLHQGEHFDDCGSDLGPLEEKPLAPALAVHGTPSSAVAYMFLESDAFCSDSADCSEQELERAAWR